MNYETGVRYGKALTNAKARSRAEQVQSVTRVLSVTRTRRRLVYVDSMPKQEAPAIPELPAISASFFRFSTCDSLRPPDHQTFHRPLIFRQRPTSKV
jgi:hypothetical protein